MDAKLVIPSVIYGILWSVGMVLFFISNHKLSQTVSYPITARVSCLGENMLNFHLFDSFLVACNYRSFNGCLCF